MPKTKEVPQTEREEVQEAQGMTGTPIDPPEGTEVAEEAAAAGEGQNKQDEIWASAKERLRACLVPFNTRFAERLLRDALQESQGTTGPADELIRMEAEVRAVLDRLPVKARAAIETLMKVQAIEGLSIGVTWGNTIADEIWHSFEGIAQACRELPDDPDVKVLARACRLASDIKEPGYPQWQPQAPGEMTEPAESPAGEVADAAEPERRFRLDKAKGELRPLAEFLMGATHREKLIAVALNRLSNGDIEDVLGPNKAALYDGQIGWEIQQDWMDDVFRAADGNQQLPPAERAVAAFVVGMSLSAC